MSRRARSWKRSWSLKTAALRAAGLAVAAAAAVLLAHQADRGVDALRSGAIGPPAIGGPWWVVALAVAVLAGVGALPAWRLVGSRPLAVVLAPCLGALVAALSAVVTVVAASEPLRWFVAFGAAVNAAAVASIAAPRDQQDHRRVGPAWSGRSAGVVAMVAIGVAAISLAHFAGGNTTVSSASPGSTWLALASSLVHGHQAAHRALGASPSPGARVLASPLAAGCAAVTWLISGSRSASAAVTVVAVVTVAAVATAGTAVAEVARTVTHGVGGSRISRPRSVVVQVAGLVAAAAWILGAFAALPGSGVPVVDGTVTLLWASTATAAVAFGLILPADRWRLRAVVLLGAVVALAAPLGGLVAAVLALAVMVRRLAEGYHRADGSGWPTNLIGGLVAVAACAAWPVAAIVVGGVPLRLTGDVAPGGFAHGLGTVWHTLQPALAPDAAALVVCVAGLVMLGRWRYRHELGSDGGPVVVGVVPLAGVLVAGSWLAPVLAPWRVAPALAATLLPLLLALLVLTVWFVLGVAVASATAAPHQVPTPPSASASASASAAASAATGAAAGAAADRQVDGGGLGALHPSP